MPRYGGSYGASYRGDFYDGPGGLESLVGSFLDTREQRGEAKRKKMLEDEQRRRQEEQDERASTTFDLGLRREGYERSPRTDESIPDNPTRVGNYIKSGPSESEAAGITEATNRASAGIAESGRRERLAAAVGAALSETDPNRRAAAIAAAVREAPEDRSLIDNLMQKPGIKGNWKEIVEPDGRIFYFDPDTKETRDSGRRTTPPRRPGAGRPGSLTDDQREQRAVAGQIDDTRSDLSRAEREAEPQMRRPSFLQEKDVPRFKRDSAAAAGKVGALQERSDSLTNVNDRLVAKMAGRTLPPKSEVPPPRGPAPQMPRGYQMETQKALRAAQEAVATGEMTQQEADALLSRAVAAIKSRYR